MTELDDNIVTLKDEEGQEHNFVVLDMLSVKGNDYVLLVPAEDDEEEDEQEAVIFRVEETENEHTLLIVEDDEEWEAVANAWEEANYDPDDDDLDEETD